MLESVVKVKFQRWEYPTWNEGFHSAGKIIKYHIWYLMLMSGEIEITQEAITFRTIPEDLGYQSSQTPIIPSLNFKYETGL